MSRSDPRFEVPPEYADVYEKAFRSASGHTGREDDADPGLSHDGPSPRRRVLLGVLAAVVVVVVALVAFALGRATAGSDAPAPTGRSAASGATASPVPRIAPVRPERATSTCPPPAVSDADGRQVSFAPGNTLDDVRATSWACSGLAAGQELVLTLPAGRSVTSVGVLPTTRVSGVAVNQVGAVDWRFGDGATYRQDLVGGDVAQIRTVPATTSRTVRVRLVAVSPGSADLTGLASVYLFGPGQ